MLTSQRKQLDTRRIDLEPCGIFESVQFNLTFPYYRNVQHKAIIVKVDDITNKDPVPLNRAIQELSSSLSIAKILFTIDPT